MNTLTEIQANNVLDQVLQDMYDQDTGATSRWVWDLDKATLSLGEANGLGQKRTHEIVLAASMNAIKEPTVVDTMNGGKFPYTAFWKKYNALVEHYG